MDTRQIRLRYVLRYASGYSGAKCIEAVWDTLKIRCRYSNDTRNDMFRDTFVEQVEDTFTIRRDTARYNVSTKGVCILCWDTKESLHTEVNCIA